MHCVCELLFSLVSNALLESRGSFLTKPRALGNGMGDVAAAPFVQGGGFLMHILQSKSRPLSLSKATWKRCVERISKAIAVAVS